MYKPVNHGILSKLKIDADLADYFCSLGTEEKFQWFCTVFESGLTLPADVVEYRPPTIQGLYSFFEDIKKELDEEGVEFEDDSDIDWTDEDEFNLDEFCRISIDETNALLESNSLKEIRATVRSLFEDGFILVRNPIMEKYFKKSKETTYIRVYDVLTMDKPICYN